MPGGIFDYLMGGGWNNPITPGVLDRPEDRFAAQNAAPEQQDPRYLDQLTQHWQDVASGEVARRGLEDINRNPIEAGMAFAPGAIRGFHGSPHLFAPEPGAPLGRFSWDKIGTGEGNQMFGRAPAYLSEAEPTAMYYRDKLSKDSPGHMYAVEVKGDPQDFLHWDQPLAKQSEAVRQKLEPLLQPYYEGVVAAEKYGLSPAWWHDPLKTGKITGNELHTLLGKGDEMLATESLQKAGIPGIRYLDQISRTEGTGTHNYAVWDIDRLNIMRRYGLLPPLAASGLAGADQ